MNLVKTVENLLCNSINTDLCCHCGACSGVCSVSAINIHSNDLIVAVDKCVDCGLCISVCPAKGYALSDLTMGDIVDLPKYAACSNDPSIMEKASSGGFVTQTLLSLLDSGEITAAAVVVSGETLDEPSAKYIVTSKREDVLSARRSKYTQASIDTVLEYVKKNDGRYAIVGLPCQLYALTKAMEQIPSLRSRIVYKIGMVCGYTYEESCIDGLLKVLSTTRNETANIMGWREDGLPGKFAVKLKNDNILSMPFADEHSIDVTYYAQNRCLLCKDCLCEYGDVVCADIGGWSKRKTLVMTRSVAGHKLVKELHKCMDIEPCDIPFEKTVLPFMLREKRSKVDIRIKKRNKCSISVTSFQGGYSPKLLLAQKIAATQSIKLQEYARNSRERHTPKKMLTIGHKSYHKLSEKFSLKVLFKLECYITSFLNKNKTLCKKVYQRLFGRKINLSHCKDNNPLNVAVVGLGRWGSQYLPMISKLPQFNLVAAYDSDFRKLESYSKQYDFNAAESLRDLCDHYGAEAVLVLSPTTTHAQVFSEIAQYRLPVYLEKPIAVSSDEAADMITVSNKHKTLLYVAHSMKYESSIREIKSLLNSGALGQIDHIRISRTVKQRNDVDYLNAPLYQIGVHLLDVILYLLGDNDLGGKIYKFSVGKIDDVTFYHGKTHIHMQYGFGTVYNFSLQITAENGYVTLADGVLTISIHGKTTIHQIPMMNEKTIVTQLNEFYCAVRKGEPFLNTKENAEKIMMLCEKISNSGDNI